MVTAGVLSVDHADGHCGCGVLLVDEKLLVDELQVLWK